MKFTNKEKQLIQAIASNEIYDIPSYIKYSNNFYIEKIEKNNIQSAFEQDTRFEKTFYCPKELNKNKANLVSESDFKKKKSQKKINPEKYTRHDVKLSYTSGCINIEIDNIHYSIDFYQRAIIPNSFDEIISFLTIWEYLKSENLIIQTDSEINSQDFSIFCYKKQNKKTTQPLNYTSLEVEDVSYLDYTYEFKMDKYLECKYYIGKRILPSAKLKSFVRKGFKTTEERSIFYTLIAAWVAIAVAIIIGITSILFNLFNDNSQNIIDKINNVIIELQESRCSSEKIETEQSERTEEILHTLQQIQENQDTEDTKQIQ